MSVPVTIDVPHALGLAEARRRVQDGIGKVAGWIPGGTMVEHHWDGDMLHFTLQAMGQQIASQLDVRADRVIATVDLPSFLAVFAEKLKAKLAKEAPKLLR